MQASLRPASEGPAPLSSRGHDSVLWENQRRISDIGFDMPHWGAEIIKNAWNRDAQPYDLSAGNKRDDDPPALSGLYGVVDAADSSAPPQDGRLRKRRQSLRVCELGGNLMMYPPMMPDVDDDGGFTDSNAQLTLRTAMAELMIKELVEKASLIEKVSTNE